MCLHMQQRKLRNGWCHEGERVRKDGSRFHLCSLPIGVLHEADMLFKLCVGFKFNCVKHTFTNLAYIFGPNSPQYFCVDTFILSFSFISVEIRWVVLFRVNSFYQSSLYILRLKQPLAYFVSCQQSRLAARLWLVLLLSCLDLYLAGDWEQTGDRKSVV